MNSQPKISVIVPVYKTEGLLDRCVESIVGQTYKNLEIIYRAMFFPLSLIFCMRDKYISGSIQSSESTKPM